MSDLERIMLSEVTTPSQKSHVLSHWWILACNDYMYICGGKVWLEDMELEKETSLHERKVARTKAYRKHGWRQGLQEDGSIQGDQEWLE